MAQPPIPPVSNPDEFYSLLGQRLATSKLGRDDQELRNALSMFLVDKPAFRTAAQTYILNKLFTEEEAAPPPPSPAVDPNPYAGEWAKENRSIFGEAVAGLDVGLDYAQMAYGYGGSAIADMLGFPETAQQLFEFGQAQSAEVAQAQLTSPVDVVDEFNEGDFFGTLNDAGKFVVGNIASWLPPIVAGAVAAPKSGLAAVAAGGAVSLPYLFGFNVDRQAEEIAKRDPSKPVTHSDIDFGNALYAALPQAGLEGVQIALPFSRFNGFWTRFGLSMAAGGGVEAGQQMLERLQADLPVLDDEAKEEYAYAFLGGALVSGALSVPGHFLSRRRSAEDELDVTVDDLEREDGGEGETVEAHFPPPERRRTAPWKPPDLPMLPAPAPPALMLPKPSPKPLAPEEGTPETARDRIERIVMEGGPDVYDRLLKGHTSVLDSSQAYEAVRELNKAEFRRNKIYRDALKFLKNARPELDVTILRPSSAIRIANSLFLKQEKSEIDLPKQFVTDREGYTAENRKELLGNRTALMERYSKLLESKQAAQHIVRRSLARPNRAKAAGVDVTRKTDNILQAVANPNLTPNQVRNIFKFNGIDPKIVDDPEKFLSMHALLKRANQRLKEAEALQRDIQDRTRRYLEATNRLKPRPLPPTTIEDAILQRYSAPDTPPTLETPIPQRAEPKPGVTEVSPTIIPDDFLPQKQTAETPGIGVTMDEAQIAALLSRGMYAGDMAETGLKEFLQNSFDAIKAAIKRGQLQPGEGEIHIRTDDTTNTVTISDNGIGMSLDDLQHAFFRIGGTRKRDLALGERSGGFGVAKLQFFSTNQHLKVQTVKDGLKHTVETSGAEISGMIADKTKKFKVVTEETVRKNGTTVVIQYPKTYLDAHGEVKQVRLPSGLRFLEPALFEGVSVTFNGKSSTFGTLPASYSPDRRSTVDFPWGTADLYWNKGGVGNSYVLSAGAPQFYEPIYVQGKSIPRYDVILNIRPKVDSNDPFYPFANNREGFRIPVRNDINNLYKLIIEQAEIFAVAKSFEENAKFTLLGKPPGAAHANLTTVSVSTRAAYDKSRTQLENLLPKDIRVTSKDVVGPDGKSLLGFELEKFTMDMAKHGVSPDSVVFVNNTDMKLKPEAMDFFLDLGNLLRKALYEAGRVPELAVLRDRYSGIGIDKTYKGMNIKVPFDGIFLNPLARLNLGKGPAYTLESAAESMAHTIMHEIAHTQQRNHYEQFTTAMSSNYEYIPLAGGLSHSRIASEILQILNKHENTYKELVDDFVGASNIGKPLEGAKDPGEGERSAGDPFGIEQRETDPGARPGVRGPARVFPGVEEDASAFGSSARSAYEGLKAQRDKVRNDAEQAVDPKKPVPPEQTETERKATEDAIKRKRDPIIDQVFRWGSRIPEAAAKIADFDRKYPFLAGNPVTAMWLHTFASMRGAASVHPLIAAYVEAYSARMRATSDLYRIQQDFMGDIMKNDPKRKAYHNILDFLQRTGQDIVMDDLGRIVYKRGSQTIRLSPGTSEKILKVNQAYKIVPEAYLQTLLKNLDEFGPAYGLSRKSSKTDLDAAIVRIRADIDAAKKLDSPESKLRRRELQRNLKVMESLSDTFGNIERFANPFKPYVPNMRFGNYVVAAYDAETNKLLYLKPIETTYGFIKPGKKQIDELRSEARALYPNARISDFELTYDRLKGSPELMNHDTLASIMATATTRDLKKILDLKGVDDIEDVIESNIRGILRNSVPNGFMKRLLPRSFIEGHSRDWDRVWATYSTVGASTVAGAAWAPVFGQLDAKLIDTQFGGLLGPSIRNFIDNYREYMNNPLSDMGGIRSFQYLWALGFRPATAMLQMANSLIQVPARVIELGGGAEGFRSILTSLPLHATRLMQLGFKTDIAGYIEKTFKDRPQLMEAMLKIPEVMETNFMQDTMTELQRVSKRDTAQTGIRLRKALSDLTAASGMMMNAVEMSGRIAAFEQFWKSLNTPQKVAAAINRFKDNPDFQSFRDANRLDDRTAMTAWSVIDSYGAVGKESRGQWQRGLLGAVVFPLQNMPSQLLEAQIRLGMRAIKTTGDPKAKAALAYSVLMYAAMAGLVAIPGWELLEGLYEIVNEAFSGVSAVPRLELRKWLIDEQGLSPLQSQMTVEGILGPATGVKLADRIALQLPAQDFIKTMLQAGFNPSSVKLDDVTGISGQTLSGFARTIEALRTDAPTMEALAPAVPAALRDVLTAMSWTGRPTIETRRGTPLMTTEDLTPLDFINRAIGFQPQIVGEQSLRQFYENQSGSTERAVKQRFSNRLGELFVGMAKARQDGNNDAFHEQRVKFSRVYREAVQYGFNLHRLGRVTDFGNWVGGLDRSVLNYGRRSLVPLDPHGLTDMQAQTRQTMIEASPFIEETRGKQ